MNLKKNIQTKKTFTLIFVGSILLSFFLWIIVLLREGGDSNQFSVFFLKCGNLFADTTNVIGYSITTDPYNNMVNGLAEKSYPPLTYAIMHLMSGLISNGGYGVDIPYTEMYKDPRFLIIFFIISIICVILFYEVMAHYVTGSRLVKILVSLSIIVSAPVIFTLERANTILLTVGLCLFYVFNYDNENKVIKELALISLAVAASFKMTPAILGILLIYNKQWKEAIRTIIYGVLFFLGPFFVFDGGLKNIEYLIRNMQEHFKVYTPYDGCTLLASFYHYTKNAGYNIQKTLDIITKICCFIFIVACPLYKLKWEKIFVVLLVVVILPSHSGYYNILYLIPAMIMFLNEENHKKSDYLVLLSFLIILCPLQTPIGQAYINYHLSLPLLVVIMAIRGLQNIFLFINTHKGKEKYDQ